MYSEIHALCEELITTTSQYINYDIPEDILVDTIPEYINDCKNDIIEENAIHIFLVYCGIRPSCMVLQDNYIYKKRKELISTTEFNKFIILLHLCTFKTPILNANKNNLKISYSL